jgi:hypothetical protein
MWAPTDGARFTGILPVSNCRSGPAT